ncbi:MAG: hypothetical protein LBD13_03635 [Spirochaetaceae bacterium]|jgi:hypothetical protein|nr:hypothetical protein [Spirochaetaceae bacterium]
MAETTLNEQLAARITAVSEEPDQGADSFERALEIQDIKENREKTRNTVASFVQSYCHKDKEMTNSAWLEGEFAKYPNIWKDPEEGRNAAETIAAQIERFETEKRKLAACREKGVSRGSYLEKAIEDGAQAQGVTNVGAYAAEIDRALAQANSDNIQAMYRMDGGINQQYNLDGFIAEQHHVNTFNIEAAAQGSPLRAEVLQPAPGETYGKNSVDIVIRDENGNIVKKYQSKYGADSKKTKELFDKGDYRGQRKLVPEGQGKDIAGSTETIECEGIKSKPLSKEEAKERQQKVQEEQEAKQYEWNEVNKSAVAKNIAGKAGVAALCAVGFQGARILGRRLWNTVTGKPNNSTEEDAAEFAESALKSGASAGLTVAVTGGITVAVKSGWLGKVLQGTPVGAIANAVCVGVENVKVLCEFAAGKITGEEALDKAADTTCSLVGSLALGAKGAALGAGIGAALGPIGAAIGGIAGGMIGGIAGSTIGHALYEGGKAIVKTVAHAVKSIATGIKEGAKNLVRGLASLFDF